MGLPAWTENPRAPEWGKPPLPHWLRAFRPYQLQAVQQIVEAFAQGNTIVVLEAPTGSGKTAIAEAVRRLLHVRALYTCSDRGLQDQFLESFDYAKVLKGRRNYPTLLFPDRFYGEKDEELRLTAEDCDAGVGVSDEDDVEVEVKVKTAEDAEDDVAVNGDDVAVNEIVAVDDGEGGNEEAVGKKGGPGCSFCEPMEECPYRVAKADALAADLACTNLAYLLTEANGPGKLSGQKFVVVDEADRLEEILMLAVSLKISERLRLMLHAPLWPSLTDLQTRAGAAVWANWLHDFHNRLFVQMSMLEAQLKGRPLRRGRRENKATVKARRRLRQYTSAYDKVTTVREGLNERRWVLEVSNRAVEFKPIRVDWAGPEYLWKHANKWLLMSATVLNAPAMLRDLGITGNFAVVRMPSTFPVERRPIYFTPVANVVRDEEDAAVPKLAYAIRQIMARHPEDRILVHVVSYRLMNRLRELFTGEMRAIWYAGSDARADILAQFESEPAAVLFAPALDRGLDLPDELCRAIVVCKVPWPSLGDKQVKARRDGRSVEGREWYVLQTLRTLVQMTGRGMRHADDACASYVLDSQFEVLRRRDGRYLPKWWTEAVQEGRL